MTTNKPRIHISKCTALRNGCSLESAVCNVMCWAFIVTILPLLWEYYVNRIWTIGESANLCVCVGKRPRSTASWMNTAQESDDTTLDPSASEPPPINITMKAMCVFLLHVFDKLSLKSMTRQDTTSSTAQVLLVLCVSVYCQEQRNLHYQSPTQSD